MNLEENNFHDFAESEEKWAEDYIVSGLIFKTIVELILHTVTENEAISTIFETMSSQCIRTSSYLTVFTNNNFGDRIFEISYCTEWHRDQYTDRK